MRCLSQIPNYLCIIAFRIYYSIYCQSLVLPLLHFAVRLGSVDYHSNHRNQHCPIFCILYPNICFMYYPPISQQIYILWYSISKMRTIICILDLLLYLDYSILADLQDCIIHYPCSDISTILYLMSIIVFHLCIYSTTVHPFLNFLRQKYLILEPVSCWSRMLLGNPGLFDILLPELILNIYRNNLLVVDGNR